MTTIKLRRGRRGATAAVLLVGGGGVAGATWASGDHGLAVGLVAFYVLAAVTAFVWAGRSGDVAAILRIGGDERQRGMDRDANAVAGVAMSVAAVTGAIVQTARDGDPGAYGMMCAVGGVAYVAGLLVFRARG